MPYGYGSVSPIVMLLGGHDDLVELLLARGSNLEHRDKKG